MSGDQDLLSRIDPLFELIPGEHPTFTYDLITILFDGTTHEFLPSRKWWRGIAFMRFFAPIHRKYITSVGRDGEAVRDRASPSMNSGEGSATGPRETLLEHDRRLIRDCSPFASAESQ